MKNSLLLTFILIIFISCGSDDKINETGAWIGGEIVNPNTNHIILTKNEKLVDTIKLNENNRFLYYIENVEKGIYNFVHNEYQMIYLEPGDSLMLRLNTIEFDKSLAFTGIGAERNNFLINIFLHNEEENQQMGQFYQLPVDEFLVKLDSMKKARFKHLDRFTQRFKPCKSFYEVAEANILYDYYIKREFYPYVNSTYNGNSKLPALPANYFDFRKKINYNNAALQSYYTYYRFMLWHFDYLAHEQYMDKLPYDRQSLTHITTKLKTIDSLVSIDGLKNSLLKTTTRWYFIRSKNAEDEKTALELFLNLSTNDEHKNELIKISEASLKLMPGKKLPDLALVDLNGELVSFDKIIKRPTVLYFWSTSSLNHLRNVHSKADELKIKYPEFDFIAINTNSDNDSWKQIINRHGFDKSKEFRFQNPSVAMDHLIINTVNKAIIVDKNVRIIDNHTNLFENNFEEQLLGLLNQ